jgi:hypothetical protein
LTFFWSGFDLDIGGLMADIAIGLELIRQARSGESIVTLQKKVGEFAEKVCALRRPRKTINWRHRALSSTFLGVVLLGGLSLIVIDGISFSHTKDFNKLLESVLTGSQAAQGALPTG